MQTRFTRLVQGQRDMETVSNVLLSGLAPLINVQHGAIWLAAEDEDGLTVEQLEKLFLSLA